MTGWDGERCDAVQDRTSSVSAPLRSNKYMLLGATNENMPEIKVCARLDDYGEGGLGGLVGN